MLDAAGETLSPETAVPASAPSSEEAHWSETLSLSLSLMSDARLAARHRQLKRNG
jgi:hypothetical protein